MNLDLKSWGPATALVVACAVIVVLAGAIAVITGTYDDDFRQWVDDLVKLAIGGGLLGVGRGILKGKDPEPEPDGLDLSPAERVPSREHVGLGD